MQRKMVISGMLLSFAGLGQPLHAQSTGAHTEVQSNAALVLSPDVRFSRVDSRLSTPIYSGSSRTTSNQRFDRMTPFPRQEKSHRGRNAIVGGVVGTAVGIGTCTVIAILMNDGSRGRISTCDTTGNLIFAAGGFAVGALVGAVIK